MEKREGESPGSADTAEIIRELTRRMMDKAMEKSVAAQAAIDSAIDAVFVAAGAAVDFSSDRLLESKVMSSYGHLSLMLYASIFFWAVFCQMPRNKMFNLQAKVRLE
jgi:hypothetical protein